SCYARCNELSAIIASRLETPLGFGVDMLSGVVHGPTRVGDPSERQAPLANGLVDLLVGSRDRRFEVSARLLAPRLGLPYQAPILVENRQLHRQVELQPVNAVIPGVGRPYVNLRELFRYFQSERLLGNAIAHHGTVHIGALQQSLF